jgi:hypothetical protein
LSGSAGWWIAFAAMLYNGYSAIMAEDDAIARLARQIDATQRAERSLVDTDEIARLRRQGACDLHSLCAEFVASVNARLSDPGLELSPPAYSAEMFRESGPNLIQISSQGRQMQFAFEATRQRKASTEKFLIPYLLEGEVRTYNQKMLERFDIRNLMIFFCVEGESGSWRFFDWRTRATGVLGGDLLLSLVEPLF